jgi:hypothetical protein
MIDQAKDAEHDAMWHAGKFARSAADQRLLEAELERLQKEAEIKSIKQSGMLEGFIYCFIVMGVIGVVIDVVHSIN